MTIVWYVFSRPSFADVFPALKGNFTYFCWYSASFQHMDGFPLWRTCAEETTKVPEAFDEVLRDIRAGHSRGVLPELRFLRERCPETTAAMPRRAYALIWREPPICHGAALRTKHKRPAYNECNVEEFWMAAVGRCKLPLDNMDCNYIIAKGQMKKEWWRWLWLISPTFHNFHLYWFRRPAKMKGA